MNFFFSTEKMLPACYPTLSADNSQNHWIITLLAETIATGVIKFLRLTAYLLEDAASVGPPKK